jgi:hypothetical protein
VFIIGDNMAEEKWIKKNIKYFEKENKRSEAEKELIKIGNPVIEFLTESLIKKDNANEAKLDLLRKLILNHGPDAALSTFRAYTDKKKKYHSKIAWIAWRIRLRSASDILADILKSKDKLFAVEALTDWGVPVDFEIITELVTAQSSRSTALKALAHHDTDESRNLALEYITNDYKTTREAAFDALGKIGTKETLYKFVTLQDQDNSHFKAAVDSLTEKYASKNIDKEIRQLEEIGRTEGFLSLQPGGGFDDNSRNIEAVKLGKYLNKKTGKEGMEIAALRISISLGTVAGRELEAAWKGIGGWL